MSSRKSSGQKRHAAPSPAHPLSVIWVGPSATLERITREVWLDALPELTLDSEVRTQRLSELEAALRAPIHIDAVLSPLFWKGGDGIEVARLLQRMSFTRAYRIVTPPLPRPEIVAREISVVCPSIDFDLIVLPGLALGC